MFRLSVSWVVKFCSRGFLYFSRTAKKKKHTLILTFHSKKRQSRGVDMMRRLEGPAVNKDVLQVVQDWKDELCDQAAGTV